MRGSSVGDQPRIRLEALEVPIEIECAGSGAHDLSRSIGAAWDWCLVQAPSGEAPGAYRRLRVVLETESESGTAESGPSELFGRDLPKVMDQLSPLVTRLAVAERRDDLVMFHACAVAHPETGATVVLYGPSGTGKTTLARTLCTELVYLSDETAGVASDLRVVPHLKPLSIIVKSGERLKEQVSPGRLGLLRPGEGPFRLHRLVQLRRDPEHSGEAVLEHLATVDALPELMAQTSYTRSREHPLQQMAALVHRVGGVRRVTYSEAEQLRPVVRSLLDGEA